MRNRVDIVDENKGMGVNFHHCKLETITEQCYNVICYNSVLIIFHQILAFLWTQIPYLGLENISLEQLEKGAGKMIHN